MIAWPNYAAGLRELSTVTHTEILSGPIISSAKDNFPVFVHSISNVRIPIEMETSSASSSAKQHFVSLSLLSDLIRLSLLTVLQQYFFLQSKVVNLRSNPQPGGREPCIYVPQ
jgi:hypothetical protein